MILISCLLTYLILLRLPAWRRYYNLGLKSMPLTIGGAVLVTLDLLLLCFAILSLSLGVNILTMKAGSLILIM
ncbi:hypothetical protein D3C85_1783580 [compost metagenome]